MKKTHRGWRGNVVYVALPLLIVMLGFGAIVVDVGALRHVQTQLQIACDASSLAGAAHIDGTQAGMDEARATALAIGTLNHVSGEPIAADTLEVTFGIWNPTTRSLTPSSDPELVDAVRVEAVPRSVATPLGGATWGLGLYQAAADAVARRAPPEPVARVDCFLPLTVPDCQIEQISAGGHPWVKALQVGNDGSDTMAWAYPGGASASTIASSLISAAHGECPEIGLGVGDSLPMTNGAQASTIHTLTDLLAAGGTSWDASMWGAKPPRDPKSTLTPQQYGSAGVIQGPIAVFDEAGVSCGGVKFNQSQPVERFVWGVIFDAFSGPGARKGAQVFIDFEHDFTVPGTPGGGGDSNVVARPPARMVE